MTWTSGDLFRGVLPEEEKKRRKKKLKLCKQLKILPETDPRAGRKLAFLKAITRGQMLTEIVLCINF